MFRVLVVCVALWPAGLAKAADELCGEAFTSPEALELTIKSKPQAKLASRNATVLSYLDGSTGTYWNFATKLNRAYPSVACRAVTKDQSGAYSVSTQIRCGASKAECDLLSASYTELDRQMREAIERRMR